MDQELLHTIDPMRRSLFLLALLTACTAKHVDDDETTGSSDLTTDVLASDVAGLTSGPNGELRATKSDAKVVVVDPASGALTPDPTGNRMLPGYKHAMPVGYDPSWFYFWAQISDDFYGGRRIYRVASDPAAIPEALGDVGNGTNAPDPLDALVANGTVWWATYPNTCTIGAAQSCWQMNLGRAAAGTVAQRATPKLADGTYVDLPRLSFYQGDLYGANSSGIYKVPGGDVTKPVEAVCTFPADFRTKLTNSTILAGTSRSTFAASANGFLVPLQSTDYRSALGLVKWDCSTETLTPFGPPASGEVKTFGLTQIADIIVRDNTVFWLDRQSWSAANQYADSYYALKRTKL
jgi:hypothetical protein